MIFVGRSVSQCVLQRNQKECPPPEHSPVNQKINIPHPIPPHLNSLKSIQNSGFGLFAQLCDAQIVYYSVTSSRSARVVHLLSTAMTRWHAPAALHCRTPRVHWNRRRQ